MTSDNSIYPRARVAGSPLTVIPSGDGPLSTHTNRRPVPTRTFTTDRPLSCDAPFAASRNAATVMVVCMGAIVVGAMLLALAVIVRSNPETARVARFGLYCFGTWTAIIVGLPAGSALLRRFRSTRVS